MDNSAKFTLDFQVLDLPGLIVLNKPLHSPRVTKRFLDWQILLRRNNNRAHNDDNLGAWLVCRGTTSEKESVAWKCDASFKIILKNQTGQPDKDYCKSYTHKFTNQVMFCGDWVFYEYGKLIKDSGFVVDNGIHILVEVTPGIPEGVHYQEKMRLLPSSTLLDTSLHFLESGEGSNLTIISSDEVEFKVHRGILAKWSDVLATMFETDMKETNTGRLLMEDMNATSIKAFLRFIYTSDVTLLEKCKVNTVQELINAAEKYGLQDLKKYCAYLLVERCTVRNAIDLAKFAARFNLEEDAQKEIFKFAQNKFSDLWKVLTVEEEENSISN